MVRLDRWNREHPDGGLSIPGFSTQIAPGGLRSPYVLEASAGAEAALGSRGSVRADFLYRDYRDLYNGRIDLTTGQTPPDPNGNVYDVEVIGNSNQLERQYAAVQLQAQYRFGSRLSAAATYTWSHLTGNFIGEFNRYLDATWGLVDEYPEYKQSPWNAPVGRHHGTRHQRLLARRAPPRAALGRLPGAAAPRDRFP